MTVPSLHLIARAKRRLLTLLNRRKVATVAIEYDGEGDSGQIVSIEVLDAEKRPIRVERPVRLALHDPRKPTEYASLHEALDDFAWTVLAEYHCGYENNDGGFGTILIDVAAREVILDHNDRFTDVIPTTTEV